MSIVIAPNIDWRYCQHHQPVTATLTTVTGAEASATLDQSAERESHLDKMALAAYLDVKGNYDDALCNVYRPSVINKKKISSHGFLATFLSCSVIVGFTEQSSSEGSTVANILISLLSISLLVRRVVHHILSILRLGKLPNAMCYDCACTLKLFIKKHFDSSDASSAEHTRFLSTTSMTIDRFHVKNHKRAMCKTVMRPDHESHGDVYSSISTQVAEQMFSYFSRFTNCFRGYNYPKSTIFYLILFHLKNCVTVGIDPSGQAT